MEPFVRLIRQRPDPPALWQYKRKLERPLEIKFDARMGNVEAGEVTWDLGPELYSVILHIREGKDPMIDTTKEAVFDRAGPDVP